MVLFQRINHKKWIISMITILNVVPNIFGCSRIPKEGMVNAEKSPADGRYVIKVSGTSEKYEPGQKYIVSLMGIQGVSSQSHTFIGFFLTAQSENSDSTHVSDFNAAGSFDLIDRDISRFSAKCPHLITYTNLLPKTKVQVEWTAPPPGSGCIYIRATVIEHSDVWYMDDGFLTKQLCELEQDDIDSQPLILDPCCACDEAKYELIFEGKWSRHTHPKDFPADNWRTGFSDIIGASHTIDYSFWKYGSLASEGLKEVAEHGSTRKLESELKDQSDQIRTIIKARGLSHPNVTGKTFAVFRVDSKHHLISLVSMIQPSPDWIVGVSGLELCLPNCTWVEYKMHNLFPWDAGTDGGPSYLSSDEPEKSPDVIRRIKSNYPNDPRSPFYDPTGAPMKPLARLHISRRRLYQKNCDNGQGGNDLIECATHPWGKWSDCSARCGSGKRYRTRQFKNPTIAYQSDCKNPLRDEEDCTGRKCRDEDNIVEDFECRLSDWSDWSSCSNPCGKGTRTRTRTYIPPKAYKKCQGMKKQILQDDDDCVGTECAGDIVEEAEIPLECKTSGWSDWTPCSKTCGQGIRTRQRKVWNSNYRNSNDNDPCSSLKETEEVTCIDTNCDVKPTFCYYEPSEGPCRDSKRSPYWFYNDTVKDCALFFAASCNNDENKFNSREECLQTCRDKPDINSMTIESLRREGYSEKVDCKVSEWKLRPCNATCGEGHQLKTRDVIRSPKNGGKLCPKKMYKIEKCFVRCSSEYMEAYRKKPPPSASYTLENVNEGPQNCKYSRWSPWSPCTTTCGNNSYRQKTRSLLNTELSHKCTDRVRIEMCNVEPCFRYN